MKDMDDLNMTLDDASKEIKRLQDELEHCSRRSSSFEQDLVNEKASRCDEPGCRKSLRNELQVQQIVEMLLIVPVIFILGGQGFF
jgi:hypothetical protein